MSEVNLEKLANLMEAGGPDSRQSVAEQRQFFNKERVAGWSVLALSVAVLANGFRSESRRDDALSELRATTPYKSSMPEEGLGLQEIISVRRPTPLAVNTELSRNYLSSLLEHERLEEVIATQGEYRNQLDQNGKYIPDPRIRCLQALLGETDDGLFGDQSARAFRTVLESANSAGISNYTLGDPLILTGEMAQTIIEYSFDTNAEVRKALQRKLEEFRYGVGSFGIDGRIGPDTRGAFDRFQKDRGMSATVLTSGKRASLLAAVMEARPEFREMFLEQTQGSSWYNELPPAWQQHVSQLIRSAQPQDLAVLQKLIKSPGFLSLENDQLVELGVQKELQPGRALSLRCEILQLYTTADFEGKCHLVNLCHRTTPENGKPTILEDCGETDEFGRPKLVADYLYDLAVDDFLDKDEPRRAAILSGAISELDPFNVNQGKWGRCGGDVIHYDLNLRYPARAAKLASEAFSIESAGVDAKPGSSPVLQQDSYDPSGKISPTESRIHAYLMEMGDPELVYDPVRDCQVDPKTGERKGAGLVAEDIARLMSELSGEEHICYSRFDGLNQEVLMLLLREARPGDKFSYVSRFLTPEEVAELSEEERAGRTKIRTGHIVSFLGYDEAKDEVLFRTWGRAPAPAGTVIPSKNGSLEMKVVDEERGIYATSVSEELLGRLKSIILRDRDGLPAPKDLDYPWKFPDLLIPW